MILIALVLSIPVLLVGAVWLFQRRLIYFPFGEVPPARSVLAGSQEVSFRSRDGVLLAGWHVPAAGGRALGTVLVFSGNAGNRSYRAPLASTLSGSGYSVLLFDYRGYGGNEGNPTERGLLEDSRAGLRFLETRPDVDPSRIVYYGESLGSAVALALAVERPPAALVLRSPFTSLAAVGKLHYPFLPVEWLLQDRYDSLTAIAGLRSPLLIIAGEADRIVPVGLSRRLHDAARVPKRLIVVPDADHNDFELLAGRSVIDAVVSFVGETLGPPGDSE